MVAKPLIISLADAPSYAMLGASEDIVSLRNLKNNTTRKDGYFLVAKDTVFQCMDTFTLKGIPGYMACTEWYLGKINALPETHNFSYEVLISRWNNDHLGNAYQFLCVSKVDLSLVVMDLAEQGDREFVTPQGFAAWDQVCAPDFNNLGEYRQSV